MMICGDSSKAEQLTLQLGNGGAIPTSPLHLQIERIDVHTACRLNEKWHSRLPQIHWSNVVRNKHYACFGARFDGCLHAIAIWSSPVSANRLKDGQQLLELRRFAIAETAPKNTATRMLAIMSNLIRKDFPDLVRLISYQDTEFHFGTIYKAAGWKLAAVNKGNPTWSENRSSKRNKEQSIAAKARWELDLQ